MEKQQGRGVILAQLLQSLVEASPDFEGAVLVGRDGLVLAAAWPIEDQSGLILQGSKGNMVITRAGSEALCVALLKQEAKIGVAAFGATRISSEIAKVLD
jgi:predicted regulator of Ras-like GTPase activity (Roadblock/LC7/MglB family)